MQKPFLMITESHTHLCASYDIFQLILFLVRQIIKLLQSFMFIIHALIDPQRIPERLSYHIAHRRVERHNNISAPSPCCVRFARRFRRANYSDPCHGISFPPSPVGNGPCPDVPSTTTTMQTQLLVGFGGVENR